jgi:hypothetical protein
VISKLDCRRETVESYKYYKISKIYITISNRGPVCVLNYQLIKVASVLEKSLASLTPKPPSEALTSSKTFKIPQWFRFQQTRHVPVNERKSEEEPFVALHME